MSNQPIPASNRDVTQGDNRRGDAEKIDYAGIETERLLREHAGLNATLDRLRKEAVYAPKVVDDETMTRKGGIIKRLRDLRGEIEKTRVVETEPHLRRKNAGDALFGGWYDEIQPDKRPGQRPKPGLIDDLQADINAYQDAKEAAERAKREAAEREAAEAKARQERADAEKAEREAREAQEKAERARTDASRAKAADEARAAAAVAAEKAAQAKAAEVVVERAVERHQDAHIGTLTKTADLVRTQGNTAEGGGVLNTVATEKIAELVDRSELDDEAKLALFEQFTDVEVAKAVRSFANKTSFRSPLKGCLIVIRKKGVTR